MAKIDLTGPEHRAISEVISAFASGHFVPEDLVSTLVGCSLSDIQTLSENWKVLHWSDLDDDEIYLVGAIFSTMSVYPQDNPGLWYKYIHTPLRRLERIFEKWAYLIDSEKDF